jgi:hypothetical protein
MEAEQRHIWIVLLQQQVEKKDILVGLVGKKMGTMSILGGSIDMMEGLMDMMEVLMDMMEGLMDMMEGLMDMMEVLVGI